MIGIITNPNALGLVRDRRLASRLSEIVGADGRVYETRTPEDLRGAVHELRELGADVIATCGGDGTNLSTLTEIVRTWRGRPSASGPGPRALDRWISPDEATLPGSVPANGLPQLGILRGGTVNTLAQNLGLRGHPEEILERLVATYRNGRQIPGIGLDLLEVNGMFGFLFGAAMPGRFFEAYYGGPTTGIAWAGLLAARTLVSGFVRGGFSRWLFDPVEAEVTVDDQRLPQHRFTLLVAATLRDVGLGVKVTYRAGEEPGRFHLIASALPALRLMMQAQRVFAGRRLAGSPHFDQLAARATIRFGTPQTYTLDGDLFRADRVSLASGPRITVLTP